jgi:hypothetical protein
MTLIPTALSTMFMALSFQPPENVNPTTNVSLYYLAMASYSTARRPNSCVGRATIPNICLVNSFNVKAYGKI